MSTIHPDLELDASAGGWRAATVLAALAVLFCGLIYPAVSTVLGGALFPMQAHGSLIERNGQVVGSILVAQPFAAAGYFHPRPSVVGYNPMAAGGSNLGPSNPALRERMQADSATVAERDGLSPSDVPAELISSSGSGFDPHLSRAAVGVQVARVALARRMDEAAVLALVDAHTEAPWLGIFGETRVNVLTLNLALDASLP